MKLIWVPVVLVVMTSVLSAFFFALHLGTNEVVPLKRARRLFHWSLVVALGSFDLWIFARIVEGLMMVW